MTPTVVPGWFQRWLTTGLLIVVGIFAMSLYTSLGNNGVRLTDLEKTVAVMQTQFGNIEASQQRIEALLIRHVERTTP
jgi:hypothetical protein